MQTHLLGDELSNKMIRKSKFLFTINIFGVKHLHVQINKNSWVNSKTKTDKNQLEIIENA